MFNPVGQLRALIFSDGYLPHHRVKGITVTTVPEGWKIHFSFRRYFSIFLFETEFALNRKLMFKRWGRDGRN